MNSPEAPAERVERTTISHRLSLNLQATSRAAVRDEVFGYWLREQPGTPTLRHTYCYDVEHLPDGSLISLHRPARLNKGADFVINCSNFKFYKNLKPKPPRHADLVEEIEFLVTRSSKHRSELAQALGRIWSCEDSGVVISDLKLLRENLRAARVLLLAKWFFIEQDVTYWTDSGRHMLRNGIERRFGVSLSAKPSSA
jgi:hypothetical protein